MNAGFSGIWREGSDKKEERQAVYSDLFLSFLTLRNYAIVRSL